LRGNLLTNHDVGMGCFIEGESSQYLLTVHSVSPGYRSDGANVPNEEAYSVGVTAPEVQEWLETALYEVQPTPGWTLDGVATICSSGRDSLELFSVRADGQIGWRRQSAWPSAFDAQSTTFDEKASIPPPRGAPLSRVDRFGVYCAPNGQIELFARDALDAIWWQRFRLGAGGWADDWLRVPGAVATSGLSVVGIGPERFQLFARGSAGELRRSRYDHGWVDISDDMGGEIASAPTACLENQAWINVVGRIGDSIYLWYHYYGSEGWRFWFNASGDVGTTCWDTRFDAFYSHQSRELRRIWGEGRANVELGTGLTPPPGSLVSLARDRGSIDIVVSEPGAPIWHAVWPRDPVPSERTPE
jgi:hypothetical protein